MKKRAFLNGKLLIPSLLGLLLLSSPARADNEDLCRRISHGAIISQTKTLVIAIEGLASFNPMGTRAAYKYRCQLSRGQDVKRPPSAFGIGGFVLKNLVVPGITKYKNKVEFLVVSQAGAERVGGQAHTCAKMWKTETKPGAEGRRLFLVGHSFGGYALVPLTQNLSDIKIDGVISIDPRNRIPLGAKIGLKRSSNVLRWENYYQTNPILNLPGYPVSGADIGSGGGGDKGKITGVSHGKIPGHPTVKNAFFQMIGDPEGPEITAHNDFCPGDPKSGGKPGKWVGQGEKDHKDMKSHDGVSGISGGEDDVPDRLSGNVPGESGVGTVPVPKRRPGTVPVPSRRPDPNVPATEDPKGDLSGKPPGTVTPEEPVPDLLGGEKPPKQKKDDFVLMHTGLDGQTKFVVPKFWEGRSMMGSAPKQGVSPASSGASSAKRMVGEPTASSVEIGGSGVSLAQMPGSSQGAGSNTEADAISAAQFNGSSRFTADSVYSGRSTASGQRPKSAGVQLVIGEAIRQTNEASRAENDTLFLRVNKTTRKYFDERLSKTH